MGQIILKKYNNVANYFADTGCVLTNHHITMADLCRYAISIGGLSYYTVSPIGTRFYQSLVEMALVEGTGFTIGDDYKYSEKSIKNSISFFMGMIAAKAVSDKVYHVPYLFHLNDEQISYTTAGGCPDFFGLENGANPILMEAKGTTGSRPKHSAIIKADTQLNDVNRIVVDGWPTVYTTFKKSIVVSCFENDQLVYHDIDPNQKGDVSLVIKDIDMAIWVYYGNIIKMISANSVDSTTLEGLKYVTFHANQHYIGLREDIYEVLRYYQEACYKDMQVREEYPFKGLYKQIDEIVKDISVEKQSESDKISLGRDGIICFSETV